MSNVYIDMTTAWTINIASPLSFGGFRLTMLWSPNLLKVLHGPLWCGGDGYC